jgi:fructokinase
MQPELLVFGEALIDLKSQGALGFQGYVGGSSLNVALAGTRLGLQSALATRVSTDFFGAEIITLLTQNGVNLEFLERGAEPTTLAFVNIVNGHPSYSFFLEQTSVLSYSAKLTLPDNLRAIHYGGSLNPLFEPVSSRVLDVVRSFPGFKHFDPNARPVLMSDLAAYRARLEAWWGFADWVKLSAEDFAFLYPGESERDFAAGLLLRGVSVVTVTDGGAGVRLYRAGHDPLEVAAPHVNVVDTVGAGDTFSGSSIARLFELNLASKDALGAASDATLLEVMRFAATAAAINCERAGCDPPTREEVNSRLAPT